MLGFVRLLVSLFVYASLRFCTISSYLGERVGKRGGNRGGRGDRRRAEWVSVRICVIEAIGSHDNGDAWGLPLYVLYVV